MTRVDFLRGLDRSLRDMPKAERKSAISYYDEFIQDAGEENEESVLAKLDSPEKVADQLLKDAGIQRTSRAFRWNAGTITLAVLASPIALLLLAVFLGAYYMLFAALIMVLISVCIILAVPYIVFGALGLASIVYVMVGFPQIIAHFPTAMVFVGMAFAFAALCGLMFMLLRKFPHAMSRFVNWSARIIKRTAIWPIALVRRMK